MNERFRFLQEMKKKVLDADLNISPATLSEIRNKIFGHLIPDAIDAIADGELLQGQVRVAIVKEGSNLVLEVEDNGIGIPTGILSEVMDRSATTKDWRYRPSLGLFGEGVPHMLITARELNFLRIEVDTRHSGKSQLKIYTRDSKSSIRESHRSEPGTLWRVIFPIQQWQVVTKAPGAGHASSTAAPTQDLSKTDSQILAAIERLTHRYQGVHITLPNIAKEANLHLSTVKQHKRSNPAIATALAKVSASAVRDYWILDAIRALKASTSQWIWSLENVAGKAGITSVTLRKRRALNPDIDQALRGILDPNSRSFAQSTRLVDSDQKILRALNTLRLRIQHRYITLIDIAKESGVTAATVRLRRAINPIVAQAIGETNAGRKHSNDRPRTHSDPAILIALRHLESVKDAKVTLKRIIQHAKVSKTTFLNRKKLIPILRKPTRG